MWRRGLLLTAVLVLHPVATSADSPPLITIIIDDVGDNLRQGLRAVRLPGPVATALLPHTAYARRLARVAHRHGKEVMLHLPMEPNDSASAGPGVITLAMSEDEFLRTLGNNLASLPHIVGINNHMGSRLTSDADRMRWLMQALRRHGDVFFVDSRTTVATLAERTAQEYGVPALRRHVFLDNEPTPAAIAEQFARLLALARKRGSAVAIGHPHTATLDFLEQRLPRLEAEGVRLVPVRALLRPAPDLIHAGGGTASNTP